MKRFLLPKPIPANGHLRIIAPSCSGKTIATAQLQESERILEKAGFILSYGKNVFELNKLKSSSRDSRLQDLHEAFSDTGVDAILAVRGGYNANDLLDYIDWSIIRKNPKLFCGYSDNTVLQNAILKKTGLVTYSGPNFATFGTKKDQAYTLDNFTQAIYARKVFAIRNLDPVEVINKGRAVGRIIGGNLCSFNLLQGTGYRPSLRDSILFLEDDHVSAIDLWEFHRNLQSLIHLPDFDKVQALVIGKFQSKSKLPPKAIKAIIQSKKELAKIPIIANLNFGHTFPMFTFPVGAWATIDTKEKQLLTIDMRP
jgi:muramoyltetrapeptide carboxypeptidase LdcA involved in peptidoglycan recycling